MLFLPLSLTTAQAAIASVPTEPMTRPGQPPGIYASAYQISARIYGALAAARIALVSNATAKVSCRRVSLA